jgi:hypothetical protein
MLICSQCGKTDQCREIFVVDGVRKEAYWLKPVENSEEGFQQWLADYEDINTYAEYKTLCCRCYADLRLIFVSPEKRAEIIARLPAFTGK